MSLRSINYYWDGRDIRMDKKRFPISLQLAGMFAIVSMLFLAVLAYTLVQFKHAGREAEIIVTKTTVRMIEVKNAHTEFTRALLDLRGYLFYPDGGAYEQGYQDKINKSLAMIKEVKPQLIMPESQQEAEALEKDISDYIVYANTRLLPARKANDIGWLAIAGEGRGMVQRIDGHFLKLSELQKEYLDKSGLAVLQSSKDDSNLAMMISGLILLLVIIIVIYYSRNMARRLGRLSNDLKQVGNLDLTGVGFQPTQNDEIGDMAIILIQMRQ